MGAVYEIKDERTKSRRALKVMLPGLVEDPEMRVRFAQEALVTGEIESDHLVRVLDAGVDTQTGMPFFVMDLLSGEDLGSLLKRRGPRPSNEVVLYLSQVALALEKTHAAGVIHRDLKPDNLFLTTRDDDSACIKILDFGIAKVVANRTQSAGTKTMGTPVYMAPEQILGKGKIGPSTDIYALGLIAYTLLTSEAYWTKEMRTLELYPFFQRVLEGATEMPSLRALMRKGITLPPTFDAWFTKATAIRPEQRFNKATEAVAALQQALLEGSDDSEYATLRLFNNLDALKLGEQGRTTLERSSSRTGLQAEPLVATERGIPSSPSIGPVELRAGSSEGSTRSLQTRGMPFVRGALVVGSVVGVVALISTVLWLIPKVKPNALIEPAAAASAEVASPAFRQPVRGYSLPDVSPAETSSPLSQRPKSDVVAASPAVPEPLEKAPMKGPASAGAAAAKATNSATHQSNKALLQPKFTKPSLD